MPKLISCIDVPVESLRGGYTVRVGNGVRRLLPAAVAEVSPSGRCAVISDRTVARQWYAVVLGLLRAGGLEVVPAFFGPGEVNKTRATWAALTDVLMGAELGRDCCVVSLGGGVVGDVAGFVASTFMRGVPFIQVPTTTLAMFDASVGGKTGVDHRAGKNLVGAFHAPSAVLADPNFLTTLDTGLVAQGFAEAVKHGAILDAEHARWLGARAGPLMDCRPADLEMAIVRSVQLKAEIVLADEFESGRRQVLNFGHTVAHALELHTDFAIPHGHAVSVGMVAEARVGEMLGVTAAGTADELRELAGSFGLPTEHPSLARAKRLVGLMTLDKKNRAGAVHMVPLRELGAAGTDDSTAIPVERKELVRIMRELFS